MLFIFEVSVMRAYVTVAAKALCARHGDIAQNGCENREIDGHAGAERAGDIDGLVRSRGNTAQIHPGFRRYVEDKSIVGARGTNAAKLAGRRGDLDSSMVCTLRAQMCNTKSLSLATCTIWSLSCNPK